MIIQVYVAGNLGKNDKLGTENFLLRSCIIYRLYKKVTFAYFCSKKT